MSEPARAEPERLRAPLEVRVGSATNALQPVPGAQRSLGAGASQWAELAVVAVVAAAADQLTKSIVSSQLALGDASHLFLPSASLIALRPSWAVTMPVIGSTEMIASSTWLRVMP